MPEYELHQHIYSGRENGLMLIGSVESLHKLAKQLENAASQHQPSSDQWPLEVAVLNAESPYIDRADFRISIHLANRPLPQELLKKARSGDPALSVILAVGLLATLGAASLLRMLWNAL